MMFGVALLHVQGCKLRYDTEDLKENFERHEQEILALKAYMEKITPADVKIDVFYNSSSNIDLKVEERAPASKTGWEMRYDRYDFDPSDAGSGSPSVTEEMSFDEVLSKLNWKEEVFRTIWEKLDDVNCTSIGIGPSACVIGYQRNVAGRYFYRIIDNQSIESIKREYNDGCFYKYYRDNVVFMYAGGAFGMQCFEDFEGRK